MGQTCSTCNCAQGNDQFLVLNTPCTDAKQWCNGGGNTRHYNGNGTVDSRDYVNDHNSEHQIIRSAP